MASFIPIPGSGGTQNVVALTGYALAMSALHDAIRVTVTGANCRVRLGKSAVAATAPTTADDLLLNGSSEVYVYRESGYLYAAFEPDAGTASVSWVYGQLVRDQR